ncbi:MAG: 4-(cytidine 5'-diphospho)-2-C-methyl-D-erythritol kinase [Phyllobacteriaceae bacterium]|nr:4-(cytidine 5'-diphospho)-2-C-methyl-D-erythritol kinase [Phyllobacteriaceae bacterium]
MTLEELAPAKINLCLHVTGRRADGYHLLDMLVVFADEGAADRLHVGPADTDRFSVTGPEAGPLGTGNDSDNLAARARDWLRAQWPAGGPVAITLEKNLPVASGIGGGSADAGAALRLLARLWQAETAIRAEGFEAMCGALGADVAMCVDGGPLRAQGIGDLIEPATGLPALPAVLVNPRIAVATPSVFAALEKRDNGPVPPLPDDGFADPGALADWLTANSRNDLAAPARSLVPAIDTVLGALETSGALIARMSGSGATCFGLFATQKQATGAAEAIAVARPDWWIRPTILNADTAAPNRNERGDAHVEA